MKRKIKITEEEFDTIIKTTIDETVKQTFEYIETIGFLEATVWKWYLDHNQPTGEELIKLIQKCEQNYNKVKDHVEVITFFGEEDNEN